MDLKEVQLQKIFDKKSASIADKSAAGSSINSISHQQLAEELRNPIIRKFKRRKVYPSVKDNIQGEGG